MNDIAKADQQVLARTSIPIVHEMLIQGPQDARTALAKLSANLETIMGCYETEHKHADSLEKEVASLKERVRVLEVIRQKALDFLINGDRKGATAILRHTLAGGK